MFFFFKQKTAYEMRMSDWSSDVCSSDLVGGRSLRSDRTRRLYEISGRVGRTAVGADARGARRRDEILQGDLRHGPRERGREGASAQGRADLVFMGGRDFEHDPRDGRHGDRRSVA